MVEFCCNDLFMATKHAQKAGVLELIPSMPGNLGNGDRFFESFQKFLLEHVNLEKLDTVLYNCAPAIQFMADEQHWVPEDFTAEEVFEAVRNLQRTGAFELTDLKMSLPGGGDRFFEYYQKVLVEKVGMETMDWLLHVFGQFIKFLASDAFTVNLNQKEGSI